MADPSPEHSVLDTLDAPAAVCDARGRVILANGAFHELTGGGPGANAEIDGGRGLLLVAGQPPRSVVAVPTADGGWVILAGGAAAWEPSGAVAVAVGRRLERVAATIEANAAAGLLEQPSEEVAHCLRETLAAAQELRSLQEQIQAMGGPAPSHRGAVCLRTLLREALPVLPEGVRVIFEDADGDVTVEADRSRLFAHLVRVMGLMASRANWLRVGLRAGDPVRLTLTIPPPSWILERDPLVGEARRYLSSAGGRTLVDAGGSVMIELPAYTRSTSVRAVGGGRTVLIADDDESTLAMMTAVLRRAGFRVISAENGVAASALLRQHVDEIVAIVVDAVLPGRSGIELAAEAAAYEPRIPVLLVSGHPSDLLGADPETPLLSKPFGARALTEELRRLVEPD